MIIVPVIDLKGGQVVRARMGLRDQYRPIETPLAKTSDPVEVTFGLLSVCNTKHLYVADLDAIERGGDNRSAIMRLKEQWPSLELWVDNGIADAASLRSWFEQDLGCPVLGSETQQDVELLDGCRSDPRVILSLDFSGDNFRGPPDVLSQPSSWPHRLIVMTLARVGSSAGPDLERLRSILASAPGRAVYAAGGVRDVGDLEMLREAGLAGALVASALHDGRLTSGELARFGSSARQ